MRTLHRTFVRFLVITAPLGLAGCGDSPSAPGTGTLGIVTTTGGVTLDPDGYVVVVENDTLGPIGRDETQLWAPYGAGPVSVALGGIAGQCHVDGTNERTVQVIAGDTIYTTFSVLCDPVFGRVHLGLEVVGEKIDPDGFAAVIDGRDTLWLTGSVTFSALAGAHNVELHDVANNCQVTPGIRQLFEVPQDGDVAVAYQVECADLPGAVSVETVTSGRDLDANGYEIRTNTGATAALPANGTTMLTGVPSDSTTLELLDVAPNCGVVGQQTPLRVSVPPADTIAVRLEIVCGAGTALEFDGAQLAQLAGSAMPDMDSTWTVEFWFSSGGQSQYQVLVGQWGTIEVATWRDAQGRVGLSAGLYTAQGPEHAIAGVISDTNAGRWRHIAVTYDRGRMTVYVDGELRMMTTGFGRSTAPNSQFPLVVGARIRDSLGTVDAPFLGRIDEVRIWDTVRSAAEIRTWRDVLLPAGTPGLIGYWALDDGTGPGALDASGHGRDLMLGTVAAPDSGDARWVAPGRP
ncbi:MAG TPA: LamG domain-containing protein [Gemmatimonadales bacterium]|nr:LamG domain-containing protein [Gemmatimonadales bacterium]